MNKPDWSKAPEGATHWNGDLPCPWLKENPLSYWHINDWEEYNPKGFGVADLSGAIPRPPKKQKKHERMAGLLKGKTINGLTNSEANELGSYLRCSILIVDTQE